MCLPNEENKTHGGYFVDVCKSLAAKAPINNAGKKAPTIRLTPRPDESVTGTPAEKKMFRTPDARKISAITQQTTVIDQQTVGTRIKLPLLHQLLIHVEKCCPCKLASVDSRFGIFGFQVDHHADDFERPEFVENRRIISAKFQNKVSDLCLATVFHSVLPQNHWIALFFCFKYSNREEIILLLENS